MLTRLQNCPRVTFVCCDLFRVDMVRLFKNLILRVPLFLGSKEFNSASSNYLKCFRWFYRCFSEEGLKYRPLLFFHFMSPNIVQNLKYQDLLYPGGLLCIWEINFEKMFHVLQNKEALLSRITDGVRMANTVAQLKTHSEHTLG